MIWKNERSVQWLEKTRVGPSSHLKNICTKVFKYKYLHVSKCLTSSYYWWISSIWLSYPVMGIYCHDTQMFKYSCGWYEIKCARLLPFERVRGRAGRIPCAISEFAGCFYVKSEANPTLVMWVQGQTFTQC